MAETAIPHQDFQVGDVIRIQGARWEVRSVLLGHLTQEDAVEVRRIGFAAPYDADGFATFTHAPELFIRALLASGAATIDRPQTEGGAQP